MTIRLTRALAATAIIALGFGPAGASTKGTITTESLFQDMASLALLADFPDPPFRTVQYSSFDRSSRVPGGPGWFANSDGFGGEPEPGFERVLRQPGADGVGDYLIADVEGPGAVVRLWTASIDGRIRVYLDGSTRPLFDGRAEDFFRKFYEQFPEAAGLDLELFRRTVCQRDACYAPIPFRKRLKIVWTGNLEEIHFYHVGVRLYPPGTPVESFSPDRLIAYAPAINRVLEVLADPDEKSSPRSAEKPVEIGASLLPSEKKEILALEGPGALEVLKLRIEAADIEQALRQTVLHVVCDDHPEGQVQAPVGDFFGAAPGLNPFRSLPLSVHPDGTMVCRWVMPFRTSLKIVLENLGGQSVEASGSALRMAHAWDEARSMHFRARWRVGHDLIASNSEVADLPFLIARGLGVYVGTASFLMNPCPVPTPYGNWWGEGDEKVFVDDGTFPSIFGTGSEDYYNYSWSSPDIFAFPYCGQPRNDGPGNRGFVTNFRWHILDPVPFRTSIAFYMELNSHEIVPGLSYARIGYYYARPGTADDHERIKPDDLRIRDLPPWRPAARMGARNSDFLEAENALKEQASARFRGGRMWSGDALLLWRPERSGETRDFVISIDRAGKKRLHFAFALTPESGKVSAAVDGIPAKWDDGAEVLNLRVPFQMLLRMFALQDLDLSPGNHTITLRFEGSESPAPNPEIGLDFIGIQRIDN